MKNNLNSGKILILGAGPAGIFCAYEINKYGIDSLLLEKENYPGGLAATHSLTNVRFEIGPHIFQTDDAYIMNIVQAVLGENLLFLDWNVHQYLDNQMLAYPNALGEMIRKIGFLKISSFIGSYLVHQFHHGRDFRSFIYRKVGKKLAEFNVINYTEKMWGIPIEELQVNWIKPRMDRISIWKIIRTLYTPIQRSFYYPKYGAGYLYQKMVEDLEIKYKSPPNKIVHNHQYILSTSTENASYEVSVMVNSIPIPEFLNLLDPPAPLEIIKASQGIKYRSQIYIAIHIKDSSPLNSQWIYFPEKGIPFCRLHSSGSFSKENVTIGESVYVFEYFCFVEDPIWIRDDQEILFDTIDHFSKIKEIQIDDLIEYKVIKKQYAYPLMDENHQAHLTKINTYLSQFKNLHRIGRHGLFTYDNQHDAARTGIDVAQEIINTQNPGARSS